MSLTFYEILRSTESQLNHVPKSDPKDYLDSALKTALQIHKYTDEGDVLIFLPGQDEIEDVASLLKKHLEELEPEEQESTKDIVQNIEGIGTSIDSGNTMINNAVLICVLYAALPPDAQMNAFRPKPDGCVRKIILSTNIAGEMPLGSNIYVSANLCH
jgi:HrpA-like RNA helicase